MKIQTIAKYVDQPIILNKLDKKMPALLIGAGGGYGLIDTFMSKQDEDKRKKFIKNSIIITSTIIASLIGTRGLKIGNKKLIKGLMESVSLSDLQKTQTTAVENYLSKTQPSNKNVLEALNRAKTKELSPKQIDLLINQLPISPAREELFSVILPEKKNLNSKEIFSEVKRLSLLGLVPIVGGVTGGIVADKITNSENKKNTANKIKEGIYQYLANIFLCNIGAGGALYAFERLEKSKKIKPLGPMGKLGVIFGGITTTGIIGGSYIANYVSKKVIDPMFGQKNNGKLYSERKPEALDIALHSDDIATAGILSGFKWIEPSLPFLYFISGYRAGIGYRNVEHKTDARDKQISNQAQQKITPECINKTKPAITK